MQTFETIIVGGGPAGSSCAWVLKKQNHDVAILDAAAFPRTKLCAGWVTPKVLADLELSPEAVPGLVELTKMNLHWKSSKRFLPMPSKQYSIRRSEFDHFLLKRSNVTTIEHRVRKIHHDGEYYIIDDAFRCTYLVGAGGTQCPVKKSLFPEIQQRRDGIALARELEYEPSHPIHPGCHLWWFYPNSPGYAWYVPKQNAINIGFGYFKHSQARSQDNWKEFLTLLVEQGILPEAPTQNPKGWSYYLYDQATPAPKNNKSFLIGDSAGLATSDLGEGIGPAVESGMACAEEIIGTGHYSLAPITKNSMYGGPIASRWLSPLR